MGRGVGNFLTIQTLSGVTCQLISCISRLTSAFVILSILGKKCPLYLLLYLRDALDLLVNQDKSDTSEWGETWASGWELPAFFRQFRELYRIRDTSFVQTTSRVFVWKYNPKCHLELKDQKCKIPRNTPRCTCFWPWLWQRSLKVLYKQETTDG